MQIEQTLINKEMLNRFSTLMRKDLLAHAYLFIGPSYIGKSETAYALAKLINCEDRSDLIPDEACGACPSCVKMDSFNHPDIHVVEGVDDGVLKIEQIRLLLDKIRLRPFCALKKVFIVKNVENFTSEAANAFLKTLEEPVSDSILILTTALEDNVLDTVRSRCHAIRFLASSRAQLKADLQSKYSVDQLQTHFLSYFSEGCLGRAKSLFESEYFDRKNKLIDDFVFSPHDEARFKAVVSDKGKTKELLEVLLSWVRDAMLAKSGVEDQRLIHCDRSTDLKTFIKKFSFDELNDHYRQIIETTKLFQENLNIKMALMILKEQIWAN